MTHPQGASTQHTTHHTTIASGRVMSFPNVACKQLSIIEMTVLRDFSVNAFQAVAAASAENSPVPSWTNGANSLDALSSA